jgi:hypothetical protein
VARPGGVGGEPGQREQGDEQRSGMRSVVLHL